MTKQEFIAELGARISQLPQKDIDEHLCFYSEIIDDRIEDGLSEDDAVCAIGSVDAIASQILSEAQSSGSERENTPPKKRFKPWVIVLLAVGSPLWISLGVSAVSLVFSLYVSLWSVIVALWASFGAIVCGGVGFVASGIGLALNSGVLPGLATVGIGLICAGLSVFLFFGCRLATKGTLKLTKSCFLLAKNYFNKKEAAK